jgi:hypothetical protein
MFRDRCWLPDCTERLNADDLPMKNLPDEEEVRTVSNTRLVALGIFLCMLPLGQAEQEYSAKGIVRNAQTGELAQDALVSIAKMPSVSQMSDPFSAAPWDPHDQMVSSGPGGEFRFEGLPAGLYVYEAQKPGFVLSRGSFTLPEASPDAAVIVNLIPLPTLQNSVGESPHPVFKIRGKVQGYRAPEAVNFELQPGANRTGLSPMLLDSRTGEFAISNVAPGEYKLRATQGKMRGEARVNVGSTDASGVFIVLRASSTVQGITRSVGGHADAIRYPNPCNVNLSQGWSQHQDAVLVPEWQQDGHFTLEGVFPGEYQVRFLCFGAYVQSASFGGADLLRNPVLTIPPDAPLPSLEIDYTPGGGTLQATFTDPVLQFDAVLLVPDFPASNGPELQRVRRFFGTLPDQDMFQFSNLTPGDYKIYTFPKFEDVELRNPAFLGALSGGIRVRIEDGEIAELTIKGTSTPAVRRVPFR